MPPAVSLLTPTNVPDLPVDVPEAAVVQILVSVCSIVSLYGVWSSCPTVFSIYHNVADTDTSTTP